MLDSKCIASANNNTTTNHNSANTNINTNNNTHTTKTNTNNTNNTSSVSPFSLADCRNVFSCLHFLRYDVLSLY